MKVLPLSTSESALNDGYNYLFVVDADDLTLTTATTKQAITLYGISIGDSINGIFSNLKTPFVSTANVSYNSLTVTIGDTGSDTRFTTSQETDGNSNIVWNDGVTNTDTSLVSATATFVAGDVGKVVSGAGIVVGTTIASRTNGTTVVLSAATTATATGVTFSIVGRANGTLAEFRGPSSIIVPYTATSNLTAVFTPVGVGNCNAFNVGELHVFVKLFRPSHITGARAKETITTK